MGRLRNARGSQSTKVLMDDLPPLEEQRRLSATVEAVASHVRTSDTQYGVRRKYSGNWAILSRQIG